VRLPSWHGREAAEVAPGAGLEPVASLKVAWVTRPEDPALVPYRDLKGRSLARLQEPEGGLFIVEGELALRAALCSRYPLVSVLALDRWLPLLQVLGLPEGLPVYLATRPVMAKLTGFDVHRGLLAAARRLPSLAPEEILAGRPRSPIVVVEELNDQENMGALFRNAAAFGAGAVLLGPSSADPLYRRSVRVSLGWALRLPFARLAPWPDRLQLVAESGFSLLALTPDPAAEPIEQVALQLSGRPSEGVALVVGPERHGLSKAVLERCRPVRIPMAPEVDSLNVAAATAIALHRFARLG
jgi:tRNA G18 (ribose-2'-O)-methylase SpoU